MRVALRVGLVGLAVAWGGPPCLADGVLFEDDFEDGDLAGWTAVQGPAWTVEGGQARSPRLTGGGAMLVAGDPSWTDYVFDADIRMVEGDYGSLVFRYQDAGNFYYLRTSGGATATLQLRRTAGGFTFAPDAWFWGPPEAPRTFDATGWHRFRVELREAFIRVFLDGDLAIEVEDDEPLLEGRAGFRVWKATVLYDEVRIAPAPGNFLPVLEEIGDHVVREGEELTFRVRARDLEGDALTLTASGLPAGASFRQDGGAEGTFAWPTAPGDAGGYPAIRFEVSDGESTATETIGITVYPEDTLLVENFNDGDLEDWASVLGPAWSAADGRARSVRLTNGGTMLVAGDPSWDDYAFEADVRLVSGDYGSLVFRYQDAGDLYYLRTSGGATATLQLRRIAGGRTFAPDAWFWGPPEAPRTFDATAWHRFRVELREAVIRVFLDGVLAIEVEDDEPLLEGMVGFRAWNAMALCDNVFVGAVGEGPAVRFRRGDGNGDGAIDLGDAIAVLNFLFAGGRTSCVDAADVNDDGRSDIADPIGLLNYLFQSGPPPAAPFAACGTDPTPDALGCAAFAACAPGRRP